MCGRVGAEIGQSTTYVGEMYEEIADGSRHIATLMSRLRADETKFARVVQTESDILSDGAVRADRIVARGIVGRSGLGGHLRGKPRRT